MIDFLCSALIRYHFSSRLVPWVHFVPIAHSGADIVKKVEWLKRHDALAHRIAENARNFARSYLRLEDYYCYMTALLETLSGLTANTTAIRPFQPKPIDSLKYSSDI